MYISPATKNNSIIILLLSLLFIAPFVTSFLLDLQFIKLSMVRIILIYWLMFLELAVLIIYLIYTVQKQIS